VSGCAIYLRLPGQEHPLAMELLQTMLCLASLQAFDDLRENVLLEITSKFHDFVIAQLGFFFDDHCEHVESVARRARAERNLLRGAVGLEAVAIATDSSESRPPGGPAAAPKSGTGQLRVRAVLRPPGGKYIHSCQVWPPSADT